MNLVGEKLFHKYIGYVVVTQVDDEQFIADAGPRGILPFKYYDLGKVLFLNKDHEKKSFNTYDEYISYCNEEEKRTAELKGKATQEYERLKEEKIQEAEREKEIYLRKIELIEENKRQEIERAMELQKIEHERSEHKLRVEKEQKITLINNLKERYKYEGFHHYTDITNFIKLFSMGKLLSRNEAKELGFTDAADQSTLSHTSRYIMDYVRFYYKENTPTTYTNEGIKPDNNGAHMPIPVLLLFDEQIIQHSNVAFLSGGGGNDKTVYTQDISTASNFDWYVIFYRGPIPRYENNITSIGNDTCGASITNKKNAEFLYPNEIDIKYIKKIIFRAPADKKVAETVIGKNILFYVDNARLKFNYKNDFLFDYDITPNGNDYIIALMFDRFREGYTHEICIYYNDKTVEGLDINKLPQSRKLDLQKPMGYENFDYYFLFKSLDNKKVMRIEYLMNGHLSAIWER